MRPIRFIFFIVSLFFFISSDALASALKTTEVKADSDIIKLFSKSDKRYVISEPIDLGGRELVIGENSILAFEGGYLYNGKVIGKRTIIEASPVHIFFSVEFSGTFQTDAVYPQWFGAIANGKIDCSAAIQKAIDFAVNDYNVPNPWDIQQIEGNSLKVVLTAGSYLLRKPIYLRSYTHIEGQGRGISKLINGGIKGNDAMVYMGYYEGKDRIKIHNASISNFSVNGNNYDCIGVYSLAQYSFIENIFVTKCGSYGIFSNESWCTYINKCHFIYNAMDSDGYSLYLTGRQNGWGANAVTISDCEFIGIEDKKSKDRGQRIFKGNTICSRNGNGIRILNCTFQQIDTCITLDSSGTGITIENCYFEAVNIPIVGVLYGNHIENNFFTAPIYSNTIIKSNHMQGCSVMNNTVAAGLKDLVIVDEIDAEGRLLFYGNTFMGNFRSATLLGFTGRVHEYLTKSNYNLVITNVSRFNQFMREF